MISATARDLEEQRLAAQDACIAQDIFPVWMKYLPARDANGFQVSMEMVDQADIYIGVYAWRYGWVPEFDNPKQISITEMEFDRALARKASGELKAILIFIMDESVPVLPTKMEINEVAQRKLTEFKQRASAQRIAVTFKSEDDLRGKIIHALADFKARLPKKDERSGHPIKDARSMIPPAPAFYAEPDYIGSHKFVGRAGELQALTDWAAPADLTNLLLVEAIGGNGKSMLTWEWTKNHAAASRPPESPWAGRFWYSFYEHGAIMADFCRRALAYMTGRPLRDFVKKNAPELKNDLLRQLHARSWLLILDGLERVLVAYHRIDAAEVADEEVNAPTDKIANRNPCDAIRDEDNDLLRALAAAAPSKILISSRLTPRVLLNPSGHPITGAKRVTLAGLRGADAEQLLRSCGIDGNGAAIQTYLKTNCDNHPLVIGILGGLIANYLPARGNFDAWSTATDGGAALDLASLDLIQRRNHILRAALYALPPPSQQLLSTLALLTDSVDYETLQAFNPHVPPELKNVERPTPPEEQRQYVDGEVQNWDKLSDKNKAETQKQYQAALARWHNYEKAAQDRRAMISVGSKKLQGTVVDLEQRGLLQYDRHAHRYELHPVVRSLGSKATKGEDLTRYGQRLLDHFTSKSTNPYLEAKTLDDLKTGLLIVRTLVRLGRYLAAFKAFHGDLARALRYNLEAHAEALALLKPFFPNGWGCSPVLTNGFESSPLATDAGMALHGYGEYQEAVSAHALAISISLTASHHWVCDDLDNLTDSLLAMNNLCRAVKLDHLGYDFATHYGFKQYRFLFALNLFRDYSILGLWESADKC